MTHDQLLRVVVSGSVGALIGYTATALTLQGRVGAIEQAVLRIETRLEQQQPHPPAIPVKP